MPSDNIEGSQLRKRAHGDDADDEIGIYKRKKCSLSVPGSKGDSAIKDLGCPVPDDCFSKSRKMNGAELASRTNSTRREEACFIHEPIPLDVPSIRLITVLPPAGENDIRCTIRHVTLEVPPPYDPLLYPPIAGPYTCISYVWGPPDQTRWIMVNGKPFEVRINLWNFLHAVSSMIAMQGYQATQWYTSLWIDAVSIDQVSILERNHQVQQMGRIYSSATEVVVWLGDDGRLATLIEKFYQGGRSDSTRRELTRQEYDLLCDNAYWKRAWVVQEVLHARRLIFFIQGVRMRGQRIRTMLNWVPEPEAQELLHLLENVRARRSSSVRSSRLITNIELFRHKNCENIRDRVYSLLSISCDGSQLPVDYDCSLAELALSVIRINKDGVCFEGVLLALQAICLEQDILDVDACVPLIVPLIATQISELLRFTTNCPRCGEGIRFAQHEVLGLSVSDPSKSRYACLRCDHLGSLRPSGVHESSHHGHLCVIWGAIDKGDCCDWHLFWVPLDRSEWYKSQRYTYTTKSKDGSLRKLILSLGLICEIQSLIARHRQQDPTRSVASWSNHSPVRWSSWEVLRA
jgi:ribosomal protein S27AE